MKQNLAAGFFALATAAALGQAVPNAAAPVAMTLRVDLTDAPRKIIHAIETLPVTSGPLTLVYPKWIPGEHEPSGPINDLAGVTISCDATAAVKWTRDPVNMYAFHLTVPEGCARLTIHLDFLSTAPATGYSSGASTAANLAVLSWNTVLLYPESSDTAAITIVPAITLPSAWQFATALDRMNAPPTESPAYTTEFAPVSVAKLIDSPVLSGRYFKEIELDGGTSPKTWLDMAGDGPEDLDLKPEHIAQFKRLVREESALFGGHHFAAYHFLVTLSDSVAHFGLEHAESSDDRIAARTFVDEDQFVAAGDLLPHEFTHSWNGKFRRPAGLGLSDYQKPMEGDLLWVYEGMAEYYGDVLAARAGLWTPEQYRGLLAEHAATMDVQPGRSWRSLQDTAVAAQLLYGGEDGWANWRRGVDFYFEGELIWLDVDTTIRRLTADKRSLDDFAAQFEGGDVQGRVSPYTFADVVSALNAVAPNDWAKFLRDRLESPGPGAPLGGIAGAGYALTYGPRPTAWSESSMTLDGGADLWFSLGMRVNTGGTIVDIQRGSPADKAELGPGMRIVAVNGRASSPSLLRTAVADTDNGPAVELIVENAGYFRTLRIDYHGGERYPRLERAAGPDRLTQIVAPRAAQ
jgi:predicted metalloprotease with PDZ domain